MSFKSIRKKYIIIPKVFDATLNTDFRRGKKGMREWRDMEYI